ncbi:hypothetical protein KBY58_07330 [Cyanobium sp. HWJ4-Hawea]|nr:hypothetical protein [Cyanobium sp. HWJ4-Hawea]MCP9809243.1 hypothetical protein [Cyanobium sp. HWJ4-Hawea]
MARAVQRCAGLFRFHQLFTNRRQMPRSLRLEVLSKLEYSQYDALFQF